MRFLRYIYFCGLFLLPAVLFGQAGTALDFDGRQTYALVPRNDIFDIEHITIEVWINPDQVIAQDRWDAVLNKPYIAHVAPHYQWIITRHTNGTIAVSFIINNQSSGARSEEGIIQLNEWSHIAGTFDGEAVRLYFNGELVDENEVEGRLTNYNTDLSFGRLGNVPVDKFNGIIEEVRLWNYARNEQQIQGAMNVSLMGNEEGLIGYWRFDEGEGQVIEDSSPSGLDGWLGANNNQDNADPQWVESDAPIFGGEIFISDDHINYGPIPQNVESVFQIIFVNTAEIDNVMHNVEFLLTDQGEEPDWLGIDPMEGVIAVGDTSIITFTAQAGELELGEYERTVLLECNASNLQQLEIPVSMIVVEGAGRIHGRITDAATEESVAGAQILIIADFDMATISGEDGSYEFADIPAYNYHFRTTSPDYLPFNDEEVIIDDGDPFLFTPIKIRNFYLFAA